METFRIQVAIIGAGVLGLAFARAMALKGRDLMIFEAREAFGEVASARNSEVIHAGICYPAGSLRARLCVTGKAQLYEYCKARGVPHKRIGKLIVANSAEEAKTLPNLMARAAANGVHDLELLSGVEAMAREPALQAHSAVWSPSTGIIDSHALMLAILGDAEAAGAQLVCRSPLTSGKILEDGTTELCFEQDGEIIHIIADQVINSAGLGAQEVAQSLKGFPPTQIPRRFMSKGQYFSLTGKAPFSTLIYPTPHVAAKSASLGIHLTLDMAGQARFGPDHQWVEKENYDVDPTAVDAICDAVRQYYPDLADNTLHADYSGIRSKTQAPGDPPQDWVIKGPGDHGLANHVHLFGMESPGLTSCLAIADYVANLLEA